MKLINFFYNIFGISIGIDLGTANTLIYNKNIGIVLNEPSVVAIQKIGNSNKILAVGAEAKKMLGKTSGNIKAVRPLKDGVIADFELAEQMIKSFIKKVYKNNYIKRSLVLICVPSGSTPVERRAIQDSAYNAGASKVYLVEEPVAAAVGANLCVTDPTGNMVVDVGGGTTEVAIISLGGIVHSQSAKVAGDKMDEAIIQYIKKQYNILIGEATAQKIKETIGSAIILTKNPDNKMIIKGLDLLTGFPKEILINEDHVQEALAPCVSEILAICKNSLEHTQPEVVTDIIERGITLAGGGCLLRNLDIYIRKIMGIPVIIAPNPMECVARGTGKMIENFEKYKSMLTYY